MSTDVQAAIMRTAAAAPPFTDAQKATIRQAFSQGSPLAVPLASAPNIRPSQQHVAHVKKAMKP